MASLASKPVLNRLWWYFEFLQERYIYIYFWFFVRVTLLQYAQGVNCVDEFHNSVDSCRNRVERKISTWSAPNCIFFASKAVLSTPCITFFFNTIMAVVNTIMKLVNTIKRPAEIRVKFLFYIIFTVSRPLRLISRKSGCKHIYRVSRKSVNKVWNALGTHSERFRGVLNDMGEFWNEKIKVWNQKSSYSERVRNLIWLACDKNLNWFETPFQTRLEWSFEQNWIFESVPNKFKDVSKAGWWTKWQESQNIPNSVLNIFQMKFENLIRTASSKFRSKLRKAVPNSFWNWILSKSVLFERFFSNSILNQILDARLECLFQILLEKWCNSFGIDFQHIFRVRNSSLKERSTFRSRTFVTPYI